MSYGIVRVQKMTSGSVKGIEIHDRREKGKSHTNPDIDFSQSEQNYDLHPAQHENFYQAVKERIDQLELKRAVRKDAIVMAQVLVTSDGAFFAGLADETASRQMRASHEVYASGLPFTQGEIEKAGGADATREFFQKAYDFLADRYGRENVISATVHMDEKTPHMHFNFVPVTEDGRLSAKDVLSRPRLIEQQTAFYEQVGKGYGLQRGEPKESGKRRKHLETQEFKEVSQNVLEARRTLETVTSEVKSMQEQKTVLEGEISALKVKCEGRMQELSSLGEQIGEVRAELEAVETAVKRKMDEGSKYFGMGTMKERIAAARKEADKENRLRLLERFISLPHIKPLWEQFFQPMNRGKDRKSKQQEY